jgi:hypothetical protein
LLHRPREEGQARLQHEPPRHARGRRRVIQPCWRATKSNARS